MFDQIDTALMSLRNFLHFLLIHTFEQQYKCIKMYI